MVGIACRPISSIAPDLKLVQQLYCNDVLCQPNTFAAPGDRCIVDRKDFRICRYFPPETGNLFLSVDQQYTRDLVGCCVISAVTEAGPKPY